MTPEEKEQREDDRKRVLEFLADRSALAFGAAEIMELLNRGRQIEITRERVVTAVQFLVSKGFAQIETDPLGSTNYFQATADGVLAFERM